MLYYYQNLDASDSSAIEAASDWWLSGGVSSGDVVAVWNFSDAADETASLTDLSGNSNTLTKTGSPVWASGTGWDTFSTLNYLSRTSLLTGTGAKTVIVECVCPNNNSAEGFLGLYDVGTSGTCWDMTPEIGLRVSSGNRIFDTGANIGTTSIVAVTFSSGGSTSNLSAYLDGSALGVTSTSVRAINIGTGEMRVGRTGGAVGGAAFSGSVQRVAMYSAELTSGQVSAITSAMQAL